jgi:hypothetical protein
MDKFLQELSLVKFGDEVTKEFEQICGHLRIGYYNLRCNKSMQEFLDNIESEIHIYGDFNFDLDINFSAILHKNNCAKITGSLKCRSFASKQYLSNISDWNNIIAYDLDISNDDINFIMNNGIVMESVRVLSLNGYKYNIDLMQYSFPNCVLLDNSMKTRFYDIEQIKIYTDRDYIILRQNKYFANEHMYKTIFSNFPNYSFPIICNDVKFNINHEIAKISMRKFEMCKNANFIS